MAAAHHQNGSAQQQGGGGAGGGGTSNGLGSYEAYEVIDLANAELDIPPKNCYRLVVLGELTCLRNGNITNILFLGDKNL